MELSGVVCCRQQCAQRSERVQRSETSQPLIILSAIGASLLLRCPPDTGSGVGDAAFVVVVETMVVKFLLIVL